MSIVLFITLVIPFVVTSTNAFSPSTAFRPRTVINMRSNGESNNDISSLLPIYPVEDEKFEKYKVDHAASIKDMPSYWDEIAKKELTWFSPFTASTNGNFQNGDVSFFLNGKLNACYNAVDRHVLNGKGDDVAIIWEGDEPTSVERITFNTLLSEVSKIANALKSQGVKRGDVVTIYMPMVPQVAYTMLACARIGAVHSVIFAGFSAEAIADRIFFSDSKWLVTSTGGLRGGKKLALKQMCDKACLDKEKTDCLEKMFVFTHYSNEADEDKTADWVEGRDVDFDELIKSQRPYCPCETMDSEDSMFLLYTSGSTGSPKGLVHTTAGYCLYAMHTTKTTFDLKEGDVYACVADAGWITGHSYIVYGPLLNGMSTFMFESTPMYPNVGRYWDMIERHKITQFYTAPTAIRSLMRFGDTFPADYDLSSLRVLGSVGEPINPEAWRWYYEVIGKSKCTVVDTYWQTETGGHVVTNIPNTIPAKPGSCTLPFYGIEAVVLDAQTGKELAKAGEVTEEDVNGVLAFAQPWPGMARTCLGDHGRYLATYMAPYPGYYFPGDGCRKDKDGYIWITGRVDDVLNVSGHRIGTAEVESALVAQSAVAQAAVVGFPHEVKGQGLCCFATLTVEETDLLNSGTTNRDELIKSLRMAVRTAIGPFASPDMILITPALPMTRSGKIMRRILRKIASGEEDTLGDTSTLADPSVVDDLILKMREFRKK